MSLIIPSRRRFLMGAGALLAAPSIVRASSLMPVKPLGEEWPSNGHGFKVGERIVWRDLNGRSYAMQIVFVVPST